jgi:hypothetical protein
VAGGVGNCVVVGEQPMGEEALLEVEPHALELSPILGDGLMDQAAAV